MTKRIMPNTPLQEYYRILGVPNTASLETIQKAYRTKAKLLHPDKNKQPDAHENFCQLNEAFENLKDFKTGKYTNSFENQESESQYNSDREKARERAKAYAKMKYEEFLKTDYYKSVSSLETILMHLSVFLAIVCVIILPIVAIILYGLNGLWASLLINFVASPMTVHVLKSNFKLNSHAFFDSMTHVIQTKVFLVVLFTIANLFILLKYGLQTLISINNLSLAYLMAIVIAFIICKIKRIKSKIYFYTLCFSPMIVNSLIMINYIVSSHPSKETYAFTHDTQRGYRGQKQESTFIYLNDNMYEEYPGIRAFIDYESMQNMEIITYTFKNGCLGFRVMTDYEFR
jgi:hypothetical protein